MLQYLELGNLGWDLLKRMARPQKDIYMQLWTHQCHSIYVYPKYLRKESLSDIQDVVRHLSRRSKETLWGLKESSSTFTRCTC